MNIEYIIIIIINSHFFIWSSQKNTDKVVSAGYGNGIFIISVLKKG